MENNMIKRKAELILKFMRDGLTGIEQIELDNWVNDAGENRALFEKLIESGQLKQALADYAGNRYKTWEQIATLIAKEQHNSPASNPLN
ncbi:hypothetical protein D3H65_09585 [Paraflavitalea soli]|uniref:Uncharacterized protein n=2 Tax=Paraflavitalea soli TaxID=2315862 RepID=A0A3B7MLM7_9BACT|nr:hypothetical protein D3H65_09585 [Paraflavitalea soli]